MDSLNALLDAIKANDLAALKAALPETTYLATTRTAEGESVVLTALYHRRPGMLEYLLGRRPPLDLFEAAATGDGMRVTQLLSSGQADVTAFGSDGWTALHLAAFFGHESVARLLLDGGAPPHPVSRNASANHPLHAAAITGRTALVQLLLERGAALEGVAAGGYTPLLLAAGAGQSATVELLVSRGARLDARTPEGLTAAGLARQRQHLELAGWLDTLAPTVA